MNTENYRAESVPSSQFPVPSSQLQLFRRFLLNDYLQMSGYILVQSDWNREFAQRLERLVDLDLTAIQIEALLHECFGNVPGRYRSEELIVLSRASLEGD